METIDQMAIYESEDGKISIGVLYSNENLWLSQKLMAELFECSTDNMSLHLKDIFAEKELLPEQVTEEYSVTAADGKKYRTKHYYAELQASKGKHMYMKNWAEKLDAFLQFNEQEILLDKGKVSHEVAMALAEEKYKKFRIEQDKNFISDFDVEVRKLKSRNLKDTE